MTEKVAQKGLEMLLQDNGKGTQRRNEQWRQSLKVLLPDPLSPGSRLVQAVCLSEVKIHPYSRSTIPLQLFMFWCGRGCEAVPDGMAVISFCLELVFLSFLIFHLYFGNFGTR